MGSLTGVLYIFLHCL